MPVIKFNLNGGGIRAGDILEVRSKGRWSNAISYALGSTFSHDAIFIQHNGFYIGDSIPLRSRLTPLWTYEHRMMTGEIRVRTIRPIRATKLQGLQASDYWATHIDGTLYDFLAYPKLAIKCLGRFMTDHQISHLPDWFKKWLNTAAGLEWCNWCTEGCETSWAFGPCFDPWMNKGNSTPRTTEIRREQGMFEKIPGLVIDGVLSCDSIGVDA